MNPSTLTGTGEDSLATSKVRNRRITLAAATSAGSKGSTFLLQIVAMPFAVRALGPELFGVYAVVLSLFTVVSFADFGIGPGVVRSIAAAHAAGLVDEESRITSTAWFAILGLLCALCGLVVAMAYLLPASRLLGADFAQYEEVFRDALLIGVVLLAMQILASVFARVQTGYQEMHVVNLFGAAGNFLGTVAVLVLAAGKWVGVRSLIVAVLGSAAVAGMANALFVLRRRPYLVPNWRIVSRRGIRSFAYDSLGFALITIIAPFLQREVCKLVLGRVSGPASLGTLALLIQIVLFLFGLMSMFTGPLLPAFSDAVRRRDLAWIRWASKRAIILAFVVGVVGFLVCGLAADWLLRAWVGEGFVLSRADCWFFGCVAFGVVWSNVFYIQISALGGVWSAARVMLVEAVFSVIGCMAFARSSGLTGVLASMALASFLTSVWILPTIYAKMLAGIATRKGEAL